MTRAEGEAAIEAARLHDSKLYVGLPCDRHPFMLDGYRPTLLVLAVILT